jgi:tellurite resistance protein TerC
MGTPALWVGFNACVLALLALDLGIFQRHAHATSLRGAAAWSALLVALSLGFNLWILCAHGTTPAIEFFTGYLVENSLSLDNVFVFLLVFRSFGISAEYQHRVLFWGVLGALVMRGALIAVGAALVQRFSWILVALGAFLALAGLRMLFRGIPEPRPERNPILRLARRIFPVAQGNAGERFWVRENGRRAVTTLFLALVVLETADLIFAIDSVPAIFGITRDPFLVYTSNVCAILGLRAFYFLLAGALPLFRYLTAGVSAVLIFIGGKMIAEPWLHVPTPVSLAVVVTLLSIAVIASILAPRAPETTSA